MLADRFSDALVATHNKLRVDYPALGRIAVAIYDARSDKLKTFSDSNDRLVDLNFYTTRLSSVPSLQAVADSGDIRVIHDLDDFLDRTREHSQKLLEAGFASSMTAPIIRNGKLFGFVFFNSREKGFFTPSVTYALEVYVNLIGLLLMADLVPISTLKGALATAREFSRYRDEETSAHLARMSRYARLITHTAGRKLGVSDEMAEYIYQFAPLHDVGKIAVPDRILLKPGKLTPEEFEIMKEHVMAGVKIVDTMIANFDLGHLAHIKLLKNVIACHHECWDGSGYPNGLSGEDIPLEARITTVADVFDALTSTRPYKKAWSIDEAMAFLKQQSGVKFDPDCVQAMIDSVDLVRDIHARYADDQFG